MYPLWLILCIVFTALACAVISYPCVVHGFRAMKTHRIVTRREKILEGTLASTIGAWLLGTGILLIANSLFIISRLWTSA